MKNWIATGALIAAGIALTVVFVASETIEALRDWEPA